MAISRLLVAWFIGAGLIYLCNGQSPKYCDNAFECAGEDDTSVFSIIFCSGYQSCVDTTFTNAQTLIGCTGSLSCVDATLFSYDADYDPASRLLSSSYFGAAYADIVLQEFFQCQGEYACAYMNNMTIKAIDNSNDLQSGFLCHAGKSCVYSMITMDKPGGIGTGDDMYVESFGVYGAGNATFEVNYFDTRVDFDFWGNYAGFGTKIVCEDGTSCRLRCRGNGCYNLLFVCDPDAGSTCSIGCNNDNGNICPNTLEGTTLTLNDFVNFNGDSPENAFSDFENQVYLSDILLDYYEFVPKTIDFFVDNEATITGNNALVSRNFDNDDDSTCTEECSGYLACQSVNITVSDNSICCVGESACITSTLRLDDSGDNIFCDALSACRDSTLRLNTLDGAVYVSGEGGAESTNIQSNVVNNENYVVCSGLNSCQSGTITNVKAVICDGYDSCDSMETYNVPYIYGLTYYALEAAVINFDSSEVESNGLWDQNELHIYSMSFTVASNAFTVNCDADTNCTIHCIGRGCEDTNWNIVSPCTCNVDSHDFAFVPTSAPTFMPSVVPTNVPSNEPTIQPTEQPTLFPSSDPTIMPTTLSPSNVPSSEPSNNPSTEPSNNPTFLPSSEPSNEPSDEPTRMPNNNPSTIPTPFPSNLPSVEPTNNPSLIPSIQPTLMPSSIPSNNPTDVPVLPPTKIPSTVPSAMPSNNPTSDPTSQPTFNPTTQPSNNPTLLPSDNPTNLPSLEPTNNPSNNPTTMPSNNPSLLPSNYPTLLPSIEPTNHPSFDPTSQPSNNPTLIPSNNPTNLPSVEPTNVPSSDPTLMPSNNPSLDPSNYPTLLPSSQPSNEPTSNPSDIPSDMPSIIPSMNPTDFPLSYRPTSVPSIYPTLEPTRGYSVGECCHARDNTDRYELRCNAITNRFIADCMSRYTVLMCFWDLSDDDCGVNLGSERNSLIHSIFNATGESESANCPGACHTFSTCRNCRQEWECNRYSHDLPLCRSKGCNYQCE